MASPVTLFIVEGESRDLRFAEKMKDLFLKGRDDLRVICLPAAQNHTCFTSGLQRRTSIWMLWRY